MPYGERARARTSPRLPIVEREAERDQLRRAIDAAFAGNGSVVVIDAALGLGKTTLLSCAAALARSGGAHVLRAAGSELERDFPFGVAIQLFEHAWLRAREEGSALVEEAPSELARSLFDGKLHGLGSPFGDQEYPVIHGLFWFARSLATATASESPQPLAIVVDDVHWADQPSLRFLAYLGARISNLPICLVVAARSGEESPDRSALRALQTGTATETLRPRPLSEEGIEQVVRAGFPEADHAFVAACHETTGGNVFLLTELIRKLRAEKRRPDASTASEMSSEVPDSVRDLTEARLEAMSGSERSLVHAIAVLGPHASINAAARLAELEPRTANELADSLVGSDVLAPDMPLRLNHGLIESAVLQSMSPLARARRQRLAAQVLRDEGAAPQVVAGLLMSSPAEGDPTAVDTLRAAALQKLDEGEPELAARFLARAIDERPATNHPTEMLAELALAQGRVLLSDARYREAAKSFEDGLRALDGAEPGLEAQLNAAYVSAAAPLPELASEALRRRGSIDDTSIDPADEHRRTALADTLMLDSLRGEKRDRIRERADVAWSDGALLGADATAVDHRLASLTGALLFVDEVERAAEIVENVHAGDASVDESVVNGLRAWARYAEGRIGEAGADAEAALDASDHLYRSGLPAYGTLAACRLLRGQIEHAEMALAITDDDVVKGTLSHPFLLGVRAQLRLAQRRHDDALSDALAAGEILSAEFGIANPGAIGWRSTAAIAELALGRKDRAEALAREELESARKIGVTRMVVRDLRVLGLIKGGNAGLELLEQAVGAADGSPPRLESILALIDYGAALRRAKKRAAARDPLRKALELSHRGGATVLEKRARSELSAAGARPRRSELTGVGSLTPGEWRVADLAAQEMTTRMIADALFITPKTVEFHLRNIYQKLEINSRTQLADVLGRGSGPS